MKIERLSPRLWEIEGQRIDIAFYRNSGPHQYTGARKALHLYFDRTENWTHFQTDERVSGIIGRNVETFAALDTQTIYVT